MYKELKDFTIEGFFLVRVKGFHPATGKAFVPLVVHMLDRELYAVDNELEPIVFGGFKNDDYVPLTLDDLEWCELPQ